MDWIWVSRIGRWILYPWTTREALRWRQFIQGWISQLVATWSIFNFYKVASVLETVDLYLHIQRLEGSSSSWEFVNSVWLFRRTTLAAGSALSLPPWNQLLRITPSPNTSLVSPGPREVSRTDRIEERRASQPSHPEHFILLLQCRSAVRKGAEDTSLLNGPSSHLCLVSLNPLGFLISASQFFIAEFNVASTGYHQGIPWRSTG